MSFIYKIECKKSKDAPAVFVFHMKIGANTPEKGDDTDCGVQACLAAGSLMRRDSSALMLQGYNWNMLTA